MKIKDIYLCTGLVQDNNENRLSYDWLKNNNIDFTHLAYWHPDQHAECLANLNTWPANPQLTTFPFIHYTEIDSDYNQTVVFLKGYEEISNSNLAELSKL